MFRKDSSHSDDQPSSSASTSSHGSNVRGTSPTAAMETIAIQPHHVVFTGLGVLTAGATITGLMTYIRGSKSLKEDGINPSTRIKLLPLAAQTLVLSTILTGSIGLAGFLIMKQAGLFKSDRAEIPSAKEAAKLIRDPRGYIRDLVKSEGAAKESPQRADRG